MADRHGYEARLAANALRQFRKLPGDEQARVRAALMKTCTTLSEPGARGGKSLKKIKGRNDSFYRLRVGDLRVMFEVSNGDPVLLVLGIVNRRDLDRWLRSN